MATSDPAPLVQAQSSLAWMEPLQAYLRLRQAGGQPLLLDCAGGHPDARWAFIGFDPQVEMRLDREGFEHRWADGAVEAGFAEHLTHLREMTQRYRRSEPEPAGAPFTGGWMGFLGFGLAQAIEPSLHHPPSPEPDAVLRLMRGAIAFDRHTQTATVFVADLDGDKVAAQTRLEAWMQGLATPAHTGDPFHAQGPWSSSLDQEGFEAAAATIRRQVHHGDHFQANLATRWSAPCAGDPADLFDRLTKANPAPYMALMEFDGVALASASPEMLFSVQKDAPHAAHPSSSQDSPVDSRASPRDHRVLRSRPIAGTRKRGRTASEDEAMEAELLRDPKEQAEHTMLVDLVRNDIARVALPGSVRVPERGSVERHQTVMHLASLVEGRISPDTDFVDWLCALFPGGTVTGAPKVRAMQRILEAEAVPRGAYTGSAGYLGWDHSAAWNILIRTIVVRDGQAHVHAGSGIVADSDPHQEWREAGRKAQALLACAQGLTAQGWDGEQTGDGKQGGTAEQGSDGKAEGSQPTRVGEVSVQKAWQPPQVNPRHAGTRVLLLDNYDSFVHNLADYLRSLGAQVRVLRNDGDWRAACATLDPTHVVLSPGPGWPEEAGCTVELARWAHGHKPILGVCLGHQAIGHAHGAIVGLHPQGPVHGRADAVHHAGTGLLSGLPSPLLAARYHSLAVLEPLQEDWVVDARLSDGTVMAIRHRRHPTYGFQFHPESLCTPLGLELLDRFLATRPEGTE